MGLYNAAYNAAVLILLATLGGVTVASVWILVGSIRDGDASTAWMGAAVFLVVSLLGVWVFFWRIV
jgi:hypothetical protein